MSHLKTVAIAVFFFVFFSLIPPHLGKADVPEGMVLFGASSVSVERGGAVNGGSVLSGGGVYIGRLQTISGDVMAVGDVDVDNGAFIDGDVLAGGITSLGAGVVVSGVVEDGSSDVPLASVNSEVVVPGAMVMSIPDGVTRSLPAGAYRVIHVGVGSRLVLSGGVYELERLILEDNAELLVVNPTRVLLTDNAHFKAGAVVTLNAGLVPADFLLHSETLGQVSLGEGVDFKGVVTVPNGQLWVKHLAVLEGVFWADEVTVGPQVTINYAPSCVVSAEVCGDGFDQDCDGMDLDCAEVDFDGDGYSESTGDCDESDASINPGAPELCDGEDNNCDGEVDEDTAIDAVDSYQDLDGDGYGTDADVVHGCEIPAGYAANNLDCDDTSDGVNPSIEEICDLVDQNCDGAVDEGIDRCVDGVLLPPDPEDVAPELVETETTSMEESVSFLYEAEEPIQEDVELAEMDAARVAVARGRVLDEFGIALPGVTVSVKGRPEFGTTLSRLDGEYDMAINGGGDVVLVFRKDGHLPVQRNVLLPWKDFRHVPDIVMKTLDPAVTMVDLSSLSTMAVARGSMMSDADGSRQATVLFRPGTAAEMRLEDGSMVPLSSINVRATEYTVGEDGPKAMPAPLPASSAYTYAVELSVDEAVEAGAMGVTFSEPVSFYVDNFLNFPAGIAVPVGYYDQEQAAWLPEKDGLVVEVLSIDGSGYAELDVDGSGLPADSITLAELGIDDEERETLAGLYGPGESLWRVNLNHFSVVDCNWPIKLGDGSSAPGFDGGGSGDGGSGVNNNSCQTGSIIECEDRTLGESIEIIGTDFSLNYKSDRVPTREDAFTLTFPVSEETVPGDLERIDIQIEVAGQYHEDSLDPLPDQEYTFVWDGLDVYGRVIQGQQNAVVRIGYVYKPVYVDVTEFDYEESFGQYGDDEITGDRARDEITLWQELNYVLGVWDNNAQKIGYWTLNQYHAYDPITRNLYYGYGETLYAQEESAVMTTIAGSGDEWTGLPGSGDLALDTELVNPRGVAVDAEGHVYVTNTFNDWIGKIKTDGTIEVIAGTGSVGYSGDGGPATSAMVNDPWGIAVDSEGNVYFADRGNYRIRKIDTEGIITTVAGNGVYGYSGDGGLATDAGLNIPNDVAVDTQGNLYIAEEGASTTGARIRKVDTNGIITTFAGDGNAPSFGDYGDGMIATDAHFTKPKSVAVDYDGNVYIADENNNRIRKVSVDGIISTIAGNGTSDLGDGGPAYDATLSDPEGVAVDGFGNVYIADKHHYRVRKITTDGIIQTIAGNGISGFSGDNGAATAAQIQRVMSLAVSPDGSVYLGAYNSQRVRKIQTFLNEVAEDLYIVASKNGAVVYEFDLDGLHLRTRYALTGAILYEFGYDENNILQTVTDGDGNVTTLHRGGSGYVTSIEGPYGHTTTLGYTADNFLETVTTPKGEVTRMTYYPGGLLETFTDRNNNTSTMHYDALGHLTRDENSIGGYIDLSYIEDDETNAEEVTLTTGLGYAKKYTVINQDDGNQQRIFTDESGLSTVRQINQDGTTTMTQRDGTVVQFYEAADPRFGLRAKYVASQTITTPVRGLVQTVEAVKDVVLADPYDLYSLESQTETFTVNGKVYTRVYDQATRTVTVTTPESRAYSVTLDDQERVALVQIPGFSDTSLSYDASGRLETITQGAGERITQYAYRPDGLIGTFTDSLLNITTFDYDSNTQVTKQIFHDGNEINYTYDAHGNIKTVMPPSKPVHTFFYNAANLESQYLPPSIGLSTPETVYDYNQDKQLDFVIRPDGKTIDYVYDSFGRLEIITTDDGDTVHSYEEGTGHLQSVTTPDGGMTTYSYDGPLITSTQWSGYDGVSGNVNRDYNAEFQVSRHTVNGTSTVDYSYDDDGLMTVAGDMVITNDPLHGLVRNTDLGLVHSTINYNGFGEISDETYEYDGTVVYQVSYIRDDLGRIETKTEIFSGVTNTYVYTYDDRQRLETVTKNGVHISTYTYDANGNRESYTDETTATTITGTYDDQDRVMTYGSHVYTYTDNGELLSKDSSGSLTNYVYDEFGSLKQVDLASGSSISYIVDGNGRRIKVNGMLEKGFLYKDSYNPIVEVDGSGNIISHFVYGTQFHAPDYFTKGGVTYRIISDHLGSPRVIIDVNSGDIAQIMEYDEFGQVIVDTNPGFQPFGFAGGLYDHETELVRFGTRDYDATNGRWTLKDTIGFRGGDMNLYGYVFNDPINMNDPEGMQPPDKPGPVDIPPPPPKFDPVSSPVDTSPNSCDDLL